MSKPRDVQCIVYGIAKGSHQELFFVIAEGRSEGEPQQEGSVVSDEGDLAYKGVLVLRVVQHKGNDVREACIGGDEEEKENTQQDSTLQRVASTFTILELSQIFSHEWMLTQLRITMVVIQKIRLSYNNTENKMQEYLMSLSIPYPRIAYLYACISYIAMAAFQIFAKILYEVMDPFALIIYRASSLMMINTFILHNRRESLHLANSIAYRSALKRMVFSIMTIVPTLYCVKFIPVSTNLTFQNLSPILAFFIEALLFNISLNKQRLGLSCLSFVGVLFILQPSFLFMNGGNSHFQTPFQIFIAFFSIFGAFALAMNLALIHQQAGLIPKAVNLHYTYFARVIFGGIAASFFGSQLRLRDIEVKHLIIFVLFVAVSLMMQYLMFMANSLKKPSKIMPFGYVGVILGFVSDVWFFGEEFNWLAITGIGLTSVGLLGKLLQPEDNQDSKEISNGKVKQGNGQAR